MRKTLIVCGIVLAAQVVATGFLFADESLEMRIKMFARAAVAEEMRVRGPGRVESDMLAQPRLDYLDQQITAIEDKVDIFIDLNHNKKRDAIQTFRAALIDKCCRLAGHPRGGSGGGGGGGGGRGRGLGKRNGGG